MAIVSNTFKSSAPRGAPDSSGSAVGNREELSDVVNRITPEDTPIYSMIRKESCSSTYPEWEVDKLADPAANARLEGDQYSYDALTAPVRMGNVTQIFRKSFIISNTQQAVKNAGNVEKVKTQALKKGIEIRKDVEFAIVSNTAAAKGQTRKFGALPTWITSNHSKLAGTTADGYNTSTGLTTALSGNITQRALTMAMIDEVMQSAYIEGGNPTDMVFSPYLKSVFVSFINATGTAALRNQVSNGMGNAVIRNVDVYEGPYGKVKVQTNRVMKGAGDYGQASIAYILDRKYLRFKWLRRIKRMRDITANADAKPYVILGEGTLCVKNEAALGMISGLFGTSVSS